MSIEPSYTAELLSSIEHLKDKLLKAQTQLANSNSKLEYDSSLRTKIKNVLLENIANEKIIKSMESQFEQLSTENTRLKTEKKPLKTTNQVLEFTKQIDILQCALGDSILNEKRIMKRYKECLGKLNQLEKIIKNINEPHEFISTDMLVPALPQKDACLITSLKKFALDHENIINKLDAATKSSAKLIVESKQFEHVEIESHPLSQELMASYYTDANTSFDSENTLFNTSKLIPQIQDLLQKINETDIVFINRNLKETVEITFITDCSNTLLNSLEEEISNLKEYGEIGSLFARILNDLIRLRLDMNKFYSMYYEKMENRSRSESGSIYEQDDKVKWSVGAIIDKQINKFWSLF